MRVVKDLDHSSIGVKLSLKNPDGTGNPLALPSSLAEKERERDQTEILSANQPLTLWMSGAAA